jgi:hypothetical protein
LVTSPTPQQIIDFRASKAVQDRMRFLLDKNRNGKLTAEEQTELEQMSQINHFMIRLKAHAYKALNRPQATD